MNSMKTIALMIIALILGLTMVLIPYILNIVEEQPKVKDTTTIATIPTQVPAPQLDAYQELLETLQIAKNLVMSGVGVSTVFEVFGISIPPTPIPASLPTIPTPRISTTNVQVVGIDEPDIVKVSDNLIVVASGSKVHIVNAKEKTVLRSIPFSGEVIGLFLYNNTLVTIVRNIVDKTFVFEGQGGGMKFVIPSGSTITSIHVYSLEDPGNPIEKLSVNVTGDVLGARRVGNYIHSALLQPIDFNVVDLKSRTAIVPMVDRIPIDVDHIHKVDENPTTYANIVSIDLVKAEYSIESFMVGEGAWIYMVPERLYIVSSGVPQTVMLKKLLEIALQIVPEDIALNMSRYLNEKDFDKAYQVLVDYLVKLEDSERRFIVDKINEELDRIEVEVVKVYIFSVEGLKIVWKGSLTVPGKVLDQFAIEEYNNVIVLATTKSNIKFRLHVVKSIVLAEDLDRGYTTVRICNNSQCIDKTLPVILKRWRERIGVQIYPSFDIEGESENNVYLYDVFTLNTLGKLEGLAKGERVYAARLVKNILFLVTFREIDPLFAIDISDPENPKVLGFLKIPGFSEYLHPLPGDKLLGVGMEDSNLKISLFDVEDPTKIKEVSKIHIKEFYSYSEVLRNHKAVTLDVEYGRIYIPVEIESIQYGYSLGYISGILVVEYRDDSLVLLSILQHANARRAVYIGDELFTISLNSVKVYNYWTLEELTEIPLIN